MGTWNSSPHPISDIRDWRDLGRLELRPDFQRRSVWSDAAKIMLMDTILRKNPMPKIFLSSIIKDGKTHRIVIDGQQRIRAILGFLDNKYILESPYEGEHKGYNFKNLPSTVQNDFLQYSIDFNEAINFSDPELREIYSRVNKYTIALNKQELRRADFPGQFLDLSEKLSLDDYLDSARIFTTASRRRLGDVEYISELLAGLLEGPQEKKQTLDVFYQRYASFADDKLKTIENRFNAVIFNLKKIFSEDELPLSKTRFRQKADFYSLFLAIDTFLTQNHSIAGKDLVFLREDLKILDQYIEPSSNINILSEYAIKCVSDANSSSSRLWRLKFLCNFLAGTYISQAPSSNVGSIFSQISDDLCSGGGFCPDTIRRCKICGSIVSENYPENRLLVWESTSKVFQFSNSVWVHTECLGSNPECITSSDDRQLSIFDSFGNDSE